MRTGVLIARVAMFVLLGAVLLESYLERARKPPTPTGVVVEVRAEEQLRVSETVDPETGNVRLVIPLVTSKPKR